MIDVDWDDQEENTIVWKFSSPWTWNEFHDAKKQVDAMIDETDGFVDSIFLTTPMQKLPDSALTNLRNILAKRHHRHDKIILVGSRSFLSMILKHVLVHVPSARNQLHYTYNKEAAYDIIRSAKADRRSLSA